MSAATRARPRRARPGGRGGLRAERLLPLACIGGAVVLILSEFMTTFRFDAAGATTLELSEAADRHAYAMLVLGVFAILATALAVRNGSRPAAIAVAVAGVTALLLFLVIDLPDVGKVGTFDDPERTFQPAEAMPEEGFWVALIGALVLAICGAALATLGSEQLRGLWGGPGRADEGSRTRPGREKRVTAETAKTEPASERGATAEDKAAKTESASERDVTQDRAAKTAPGKDAGRAAKRAYKGGT